MGLEALKHLQNTKHRHHADVELHRRQQRAGAGGRGFVSFGHPAVERRQAELATQPKQHEGQTQPLPAITVCGQCPSELINRKADIDAAQVG